MTCNACGEKPKDTAKNFTRAVIEINNPEALVLLRKVVIPASMGTEEDVPAAVGKYRNVVLYYEANKHTYLYSSDGIPTLLEVDIPQELLDRIDELEENLAQETTMREGMDEELQSNIDAVAQDLEDFKNSPDVVDIVRTYAALQAYDTSKLGDNDIVRVLQDEQHDGQSSYYRWDKTASTWTFIGTVGDYYTKTQTDTLLAGKQDVLAAGQNIQIEDNTISATDTTYTAGAGLNLTGTQFSVNTTAIATQSDLTAGLATKQNTLTAGSNIQISNDTISATDTTYSDFVGTDGTSAGTSGLVPAPTTADAGKVLGADGAWVTGGPTVVQSRGNSTTDVMSQAATTSLVYADIRPASYGSLIRIGDGASNTSNILYEGIAIGENSKTTGNYGVALGTYAWVEAANGVAIGGGSGTQTAPRIRAPHSIAIGDHIEIQPTASYSVAVGAGYGSTGRSIQAKGSVSLGAFSKATSNGEMNIGLSEATAEQQTTYGYNGSAYRLLSGLYDPQSDHDAATKGYVDPSTDTTAPTASTVGRLGEIRIDTSTKTAYMCVSADNATSTYEWKQITS